MTLLAEQWLKSVMFSHLSRDLAWPLLAQENLTGSQPQVNYHGCRLAARQQTLNLVKKSIWNNWKSNFSWRIIAAYFGQLLSSLVRSAFLKEKEIKKYSHIHNRPIVEFSRWLLEYFNTYRTLQNLCLRVLTSHGVSPCVSECLSEWENAKQLVLSHRNWRILILLALLLPTCHCILH